VPSNGKIAMRFDDDSDDRLIGVALLTETDDVLLATRQGKAIRFSATDVREFQSRTSTGVRGMRLKGDDEIISLSILQGFDATTDERDAYLRAAPWKDNDSEPTLSAERMAEFADAEEFLLTICANGYGKLSSAYDYRRSNRGGQGIGNIDNIERNGLVVASFRATKGDQLILVTDQAKMIRMPLDSMRVIGRNSAGVKLFDVAKGEHVVSAARIDEEQDPEDEAEEAVAEELAEIAESGAPDEVTLDDGTGPDTISEDIPEDE